MLQVIITIAAVCIGYAFGWNNARKTALEAIKKYNKENKK